MARWVLPVSAPPIQDGMVEVEGDKIKRIGASSSSSQEVIDLGDTLLLPGLVNAHCHLEFSSLQGILETTSSFTHWVKELGAECAGLTSADQEEGYQNGIRQLLQGGTTTLANHVTVAGAEALLHQPLPFRTRHFLEVMGASPIRAQESLAAAQMVQQKLAEGNLPEAQQATAVITPHSLYSVHLEILEEMLGVGADPRVGPANLGEHMGSPLPSIHLLESAEEDQLFRQQTGPLANYVVERGGEVSLPFSSPVKWLAAIGALKNLLVIHGNYLQSGEIALLRQAGGSVIHCPGSHRFFRHRPFPLMELKNQGVNIGIGADSLASNEQLNMLRELTLLKESFPELSSEEIVRMATLGGAKGLGMETQIGSLAPGKMADLIGIKIRRPFTNPYDLVLHATEVDWVMINGKIQVL